jgi:hypothetical protein
LRFRAALLSLVLLFSAASFAAPLHARQTGGAGVNPVRETSGSFVHSVYFWLRPDLTSEQQQAFVRALQTLQAIENVQHGWIGKPAGTDRPIIERSYSYSLTLVFADADAQEAYQVHPVHDRFRQEFGDFWTRVLIYDSVDATHQR